MSWFANNYEKAILGGAAVCCLAFAYNGWQALSQVEKDFISQVRGGGPNNVDVKDADLVANATSSLTLSRSWSPEQFEDRTVNLFVSIPLFVREGSLNRPIDLMRGAPVHPPIPNTWWLDYRLDPGFVDSPDLDADGDGFTNTEEFLAGTDPTDPASHPPLIAKLRYVADESLAWAIRPSHPQEDGSNTFRYYDNFPPNGRINNTGVANPVPPGGLFFGGDPAQGRFKLLGHETREEFNQRTNAAERRVFARIEDQHPNKKGIIYEFPAPLQEANVPNHRKYDRTAVFTLEAIGRNGVEFKVEEFMTFTLPIDGEGPTWKLGSVTAEQVVVEYTGADGGTRSLTILKGGFPQM